ncbi:hypothetical protein HPB47_024727, partial [Ixodes persulcatus]
DALGFTVTPGAGNADTTETDGASRIPNTTDVATANTAVWDRGLGALCANRTKADWWHETT